MNLAKKLQQARKKIGLSQVELAKKLEVEQSVVANWEAGAGSPRLGELYLLAKIFNTTPEKLKECKTDKITKFFMKKCKRCGKRTFRDHTDFITEADKPLCKTCQKDYEDRHVKPSCRGGWQTGEMEFDTD